MDNNKIEQVTVLAIKDDQNRIIGLVSKNGTNVEFYKVDVAGFEDIEELLRSLTKK